MTKPNNKKDKLPKFRNLREMDMYILTESYGAEKAARIMQKADAIGKFYLPPQGTKYNN